MGVLSIRKVCWLWSGGSLGIMEVSGGSLGIMEVARLGDKISCGG